MEVDVGIRDKWWLMDDCKMGLYYPVYFGIITIHETGILF